MPKPFAVFDIDGTLIRWQLYHATADALVRLGYFDEQLFEEVIRARNLWKRRVETESFKHYEQRLVKAYGQVLSELTVAQFNQAVAMVFEEFKDQVYRYTRGLIKDLKDKDYLLFAISGSQLEIVKKISDYYGFDDCVGSIFEHDGKKFTGKVIAHRVGKHLILDELVKKHGATYDGSYAVGDSEGDISMLAAVEHPIAMNPTAKLFEEAKNNGWKVVIERKNMVYELTPEDGKYYLV